MSANLYDDVMTGTVRQNNLEVGPADINTTGTTPPQLSNNYQVALSEFVSPASNDYHLTPGSSVIGQGIDVPDITTGQDPGQVDPGADATSGGGLNQFWGAPGCQSTGCR